MHMACRFKTAMGVSARKGSEKASDKPVGRALRLTGCLHDEQYISAGAAAAAPSIFRSRQVTAHEKAEPRALQHLCKMKMYDFAAGRLAKSKPLRIPGVTKQLPVVITCE